MEQKKSGLLVHGFIAAVSLLTLNACGKVGFGAETGTSCSARGADLATCFVDDLSLIEHTQSIEVKSNSEVDVLFVVDNSGSMAQEQIDIGNKINGFLDKIKDLNWQIALTTTDGSTNTLGPDLVSRPWGDGQFRPFDSDTGSQFILRASQVNSVTAQSLLGRAIGVGTSGSGNERGISATYRAVARSISPSIHRDFFRTNAKLAVVLISDEDECSTGATGCSASTAHQSDPQTLINYVQSTLGSGKVFSFNSIIAIPGGNCGTAGNIGNTYKDLTTLTGGSMGSVCSTDFTGPLNNIGQTVTELVKTVTLSCTATDVNKDGIGDIKVVLNNGSVFNSAYTINGNNVTFATALPAGVHTFYYFCR